MRPEQFDMSEELKPGEPLPSQAAAGNAGHPAYQRISISEAKHFEGQPVEIAGWIYNLRRGGKIVFPIVRDGSGLMQCVAVKSALPEALFEAIKDLTQESSVVVTGKLRADPRAIGGHEMDVEDLEVVQRVSEA